MKIDQIKLAIFDMDGTLCNTEDIHAKGWDDAFKHYGYDFGLDFVNSMRGKSIVDNNRVITERTGDPALTQKMREYREAYILEMIATNQVQLMPGVREILETLKEHNIPIAIATTSYTERAEKITGQLDIQHYFSTKVYGDMITHQKPNPEIYLRVLEETGSTPDGVIAIEDSPTGVTAARSAGLKTYFINDWLTLDIDDSEVTSYKNMHQLLDELLS
ncbi:HAD family hydrolase [Globicatella sanguinis]